jgi:hypothetical protein
VHPGRASSRPLPGPPGGWKTKDDPCPSKHATVGPSMGGQLSGSLAPHGADLKVLSQTILSQEEPIARKTPIVK